MAATSPYGSTSTLGKRRKKILGGGVGFPACGQMDRHPESGLYWHDMPGHDNEHKKFHFFFHRRGLSVEEIVAGEIWRRFPDSQHVERYCNAGALWQRAHDPRLN